MIVTKCSETDRSDTEQTTLSDSERLTPSKSERESRKSIAVPKTRNQLPARGSNTKQQQGSSSKNASATLESSRIPDSLKEIFLAAARGEEITQAPSKDDTAWKLFRFQRKSSLKRPPPRKSSTKPPTPVGSPVSQRTQLKSAMKRTLSPQDTLDRILAKRGYSCHRFRSLACAYHCNPTEVQQASYGVVTVNAAKNGDIELLKELFDAGLSPNPCNMFGESLVHSVCRRGDYRTLQFMVDYGSSVQVTDDIGRTPLHDACTMASPSFQLAELLLDCDVNLLRVVDGRGLTPLAYVIKKNWSLWNEFLERVKDKYWPRRDSAIDGPERLPNLVEYEPGAYPAPEPRVDIPVDLIFKIASGTIDVRDPYLAELDDDDDFDYSTIASTVMDDDIDDSSCESLDYDDPDFLTEEEIVRTLSKFDGAKYLGLQTPGVAHELTDFLARKSGVLTNAAF